VGLVADRETLPSPSTSATFASPVIATMSMRLSPFTSPIATERPAKPTLVVLAWRSDQSVVPVLPSTARKTPVLQVLTASLEHEQHVVFALPLTNTMLGESLSSTVPSQFAS
jgi:hypothetical protein